MPCNTGKVPYYNEVLLCIPFDRIWKNAGTEPNVFGSRHVRRDVLTG